MKRKHYEVAELLYNTGNALEKSKKKKNPGNAKKADVHKYKSGVTKKHFIKDIEVLTRSFADHKLDADCIYTIAYVWYQYFGKGDSNVSPAEIFSILPLNLDSRFAFTNKLNQLVEKKFLCVSRRNHHSNIDHLSLKLDVARLDKVFLSLHSDFVNHVVNASSFTAEIKELKAFENNEEYLAAWLKYGDILSNIVNFGHDGEEKLLQLQEASLLKEEIVEREKLNKAITFPLRQMIVDFSLDANEQIFLIHLLKDHITNDQSDIDELLNLVSNEDTFERMKNLKYFKPEGRLYRHRIIHVDNGKAFMSQSKGITLQMAVVLRILENESSNNQERLKQFIADSELFTYRTPIRGMNDIILSPTVQNSITTALKRYHTDVFNTLESWGIYAKRSNHGEKDIPKLVMLFYGEPGVGKTLGAEVIAKELGKDLLITDCARIMSAWVGESQKNTSQIFQKYSELVDRLDNPPILLLNECDQLLSKRMEGNETAVDKMYHQMQNILLEGIENLKGLLILTTNSCNSLDPAFARRFDLKVEFKPPSEDERKLLWKLHLGEIPGATEVDIAFLSKKYKFSGGQIVVVIGNAATEAAALPIEERKITNQLLHAYSDLEVHGNFQSLNKSKIGFEILPFGKYD